MSPLLAAVLLAAYLLVSAETYLATHARGVFRMSFLAWPHGAQNRDRRRRHQGRLRPWVALAASVRSRLFDSAPRGVAGLGAVFVASAVRNTRALYAADRLPRRSGTSAAA